MLQLELSQLDFGAFAAHISALVAQRSSSVVIAHPLEHSQLESILSLQTKYFFLQKVMLR